MLKIYKCCHCHTRFVIITTRYGLYIPAEYFDDIEFDEETEFNGRIHRSHLKYCKKRFDDWHEVLLKLGLPIRRRKPKEDNLLK